MEKKEILCENEFCVYQKNGMCILDTIELDNVGSCTSCILVDLQKEELDSKKLETLVRMELSSL